MPNVKVISETKIQCCAVTQKNVGKNNINSEDFLQLEIQYLKRLLEEADDKNKILKENNKLLSDTIMRLKLEVAEKDKQNITLSAKNSACKSANSPVNVGSAAISLPKISISSPVPSAGSSQQMDGQLYQSTDTSYSKVVAKRNDTQTGTSKGVDLSPNNNLKQLRETQGRIMNSVLSLNSDLQNEPVRVNQQNNSQVIQNENDNFTKVIHRRNRRQQFPKQSTKFAKGNLSEKSTKICGKIRRKWIYVGRITGRDVTEEDVRDYLKDLETINGYKDIVVTKLNTHGSNSAFCIGVPNDELYEKVYNENYWSEGIALRDFDWRRTFFQQRQQQKLQPTV
nr:unnamed protein product [Callosobruchus chinensis]CAH7757280.1 unnamed protein product [Callosobruchus chinensis]